MDNPREFKLFVDDMRPIPKGWHGARTVSDTIQYLYKFSPIKEISLDYDILFPQHGIDRYSMYSAENFSGVAYFIAVLKELRPNKIVIHSTNTGAAQTMCNIMKLDFNSVYKIYDESNYL